MIMKKTKLAWLLSGMTALSLSASAFAEDKNGGLEEVIVTAQKRAQNLQDVPIAVSAFGGDELKAAGIDGQLMLSKLTPNLNFTVIASFAATYVRGVGTQFANPGLESSVSVYFDDVYIPRAASAMFTFSDVDRIEVLKGPQGTLYGRNATGGAIRIITTDPKPEFESRLSLGTGTDSRKLIEGMVNVPLGEKIAFRLAARSDQNDGYMKNLFPGARDDKMADRRESMIQAKLLANVTDNFRVKFSYDDMNKHDTEGHDFKNLWPGVPEQVGAALGGCVAKSFYTLCNDMGANGGQKPGQNLYVKGAAIRMDWDVGDTTISSISAYRRHNEHNSADLDSTGVNLQHATGRPRTKQLSQEFQITSDFDGPFNYVAGLYYLYEKSGYFFSVYGDIAFPGGMAIGGDGNLEVKSFAPYFQFDYEFSDKWSATVGLRYTDEKKDLIDNFVGLSPVTARGMPSVPYMIPLFQSADASADFQKFTPKVTLTYTPNEANMFYLTYARGFKSGGLNLPAFTPTVDSVNPEVLDDYEMGWKYESGNIRFNAAAFYYDYKDLQIQITDQLTGGTKVKNAAGAEVFGAEGELTWLPTDALELGAGFGVIDHEYQDFIGDAYYPCGHLPAGAVPGPAECAGGLGLSLLSGQDLSGNDLTNAPKFTGFLRGKYTFSLGDMGELEAGMILNYRTKAYFDVANLYEDESRTTMSARLAWTDPSKRYSVAVDAENLTDKKYHLFNSPQGAGGWSIQAPPRRVFVTGTVNF